LAVVAGTMVVAELCLRHFLPELEGPTGLRRALRPDSIRVDDQLGYETSPYGALAVVEDGGREVVLQANSAGFIGPERSLPKPPGIVRVMAFGDSIVAGLFRISDPREFGGWPAKLETLLNQRVRDGRAFEVINAGVGGYTAWQTALRFESRGVAFAPDLVVVLVGWNDLEFSARSNWHPFAHYYEFEPLPDADAPGLGSRLKDALLAHSYLARAARDVRRWARAARPAPQPKAVPFNQAALDIFVQALERLQDAVASCGARLVLVLWPTPLLADGSRCWETSFDPTRVELPLSLRDLRSWYERYAAAQRDFARRYPRTILIDPSAYFAREANRRTTCLFADLAHLTPAGNAVLAEAVFDEIAGLAVESSVTR
jgi:lysophospholipase L1-like esterase